MNSAIKLATTNAMALRLEQPHPPLFPSFFIHSIGIHAEGRLSRAFYRFFGFLLRTQRGGCPVLFTGSLASCSASLGINRSPLAELFQEAIPWSSSICVIAVHSQLLVSCEMHHRCAFTAACACAHCCAVAAFAADEIGY